EDVDAAVAHLLELAAQSLSLRSRLPGVQHAPRPHGRLVTLHVGEQEIDPGRHDEPLVADLAAARQAHALFRRVDRDRLVAYYLHAEAAQPFAALRDVLHAAESAQHQVGDLAGNELGVALDQHHVDGR